MIKPFNKKIGLIGAGQLGKMLAEASLPLNVHFEMLDAENDFPGASLSKVFIKGGLKDPLKIRELAKNVDILTYEIEHINTEVLFELEKEGKEIIPNPSILNLIQNKGSQKKFYAEKNLPTSPFFISDNKKEISENLANLNGEKVVVKTLTGGYDGKGVTVFNKEKYLSEIPEILDQAFLFEEFVADIRELAVIAAVSKNREVKCFPPVEMHFDPQLNLVDYLFCPANLNAEEKERAVAIAEAAALALGGPGLFAVEMFLTPDDVILINEIAPRPHNSGHHSIEACLTSQYEQLLRILLDLPLGETDLIKPAVMFNLIGPPEVNGTYSISGTKDFFETPGAYLHLYNKKECKPGRKMGHFTVLGDSVEEAIKKASRIKERLVFESE